MFTTRPRHQFLFLYTLFIIYGSLFPLAEWRMPPLGLAAAWSLAAGRHLSRSDLITNLLAYAPFGFLLACSVPERFHVVRRVALSLLAGLALSCAMEYAQLFLPARTSSPVDLLLNGLSTVTGALCQCWIGSGASLGEKLRQWRSSHIREGRVSDIGIAVIAAWGADQLAPFVPSIDMGGVKNGLKPIWLTLHDLSRFNCYRLATYALNIGALGAALRLIVLPRTRVPVWLGSFCGAVLLGKVLVGRQLSLEAAAGLALGVLAVLCLQRLPRDRCVLWGIVSVILAFVVDELRPEQLAPAVLRDFNWLPFRSQMAENVSGIGSIIAGLWPFAALGFFTVEHSPSLRKTPAMLMGAVLAVAVLALEYTQTYIPGRYPDSTAVILACAGWSIPFLATRES